MRNKHLKQMIGELDTVLKLLSRIKDVRNPESHLYYLTPKIKEQEYDLRLSEIELEVIKVREKLINFIK